MSQTKVVVTQRNMPQTKVVVTQRTQGGHIELTLTSGDLIRIYYFDTTNFIQVHTVDGSISINPVVSNEINISTNH